GVVGKHNPAGLIRVRDEFDVRRKLPLSQTIQVSFLLRRAHGVCEFIRNDPTWPRNRGWRDPGGEIPGLELRGGQVRKTNQEHPDQPQTSLSRPRSSTGQFQLPRYA